MRFLVIFFLGSFVVYGNDCNKRIQEVFKNLVASIGNNSIYPPTLEISSETSNVAYLSNGRIYLEQKAIDLFCQKEGFESYISYILGHELAHYYLNHSWMNNTGLSYSSSIGRYIDDRNPMYSREQRKLAESQADLFAGFYGKVSGYNSLEYSKEGLELVYQEYGLPNYIDGYPSFDERIEIIDSRINRAIELSELFEIGVILLKNKNTRLSRYCFEFILKEGFNSREIYNNLGLSFLLHGISISEKTVSNIIYPVSIEQNTRAEIKAKRSINFTDDPKEMFSQAQKQFEKAQILDPTFKIASQNSIIAEFLKLSDYTARNELINDNSDWLPIDFIVDLQVINFLLTDKKNPKKISRISKKGSQITRLNLSKPSSIEKIDSESIFKSLNFSFIDLISAKGKKLAESDLELFEINQYQVFEIDNVYVIRIPEDYHKNIATLPSIQTKKGVYVVFDTGSSLPK